MKWGGSFQDQTAAQMSEKSQIFLTKKMNNQNSNLPTRKLIEIDLNRTKQ